MFRRRLALALLALLTLQLLSGMALATICNEPCPDEDEAAGCTPVCAVCTSCTHAQSAIVQSRPAGIPLALLAQSAANTKAPLPAQLPSDILHVPLSV